MPEEQKHESLLAYIARKYWWHVPPRDPDAYRKRGKFYSSTYAEAEFYGRPGDPERVAVVRPLVGDYNSIEKAVFSYCVYDALEKNELGNISLESRFEIDARMKEAALEQGYDSIVLMSAQGYARYCTMLKIPRSIELNILEPTEPIHDSRRSRNNDQK